MKRNFNAVLITSVKWTTTKSNANIQWTVGTKVDVNVNQNEGYTEISLEFLSMPALSDNADKALRCVCEFSDYVSDCLCSKTITI